MATHGGPNIVEDGLVFYIDPANKDSYNSGSATETSAFNLLSPIFSGSREITGSLSSVPMFEDINQGVFNFDTTDMINLQNTPDLFVGSFSIGLWFNKISQTGCAFGRYVGSNNAGDLEIRTDVSNPFRIMVHSGGGFGSANFYSTTDTYTTGRWYNVVTTFDHNGTTYTRKIYVDGVLDSNDTPTTMNAWGGISASAFITTIGAMSTNGTSPTQAFNGDIGPVQIYNRALSSQEVKQHFNALNRFGI